MSFLIILQELYSIHQILYKGLKEAQNNNSVGKSIADVFLENQERLVIYGEYCANLASAQQELEDVMNNNEAAKNLIQVRVIEWYLFTDNLAESSLYERACYWSFVFMFIVV